APRAAPASETALCDPYSFSSLPFTSCGISTSRPHSGASCCAVRHLAFDLLARGLGACALLPRLLHLIRHRLPRLPRLTRLTGLTGLRLRTLLRHHRGLLPRSQLFVIRNNFFVVEAEVASDAAD